MDGVNGSSAHVAVAAMRPLVVIRMEPFVEVDLQFLDRSIELGSEGFLHKVLADGAVEAFNEAVGARRSDFGGAVLDVIEL